MRGGELFLAFLALSFVRGARSAAPAHFAMGSFLLLISVMGLIGWARPARLIRGVVLSAKERNFVLAARGFGASDCLPAAAARASANVCGAAHADDAPRFRNMCSPR